MIMEPQESQKAKTLTIIVVIVLVLGVGFLLINGLSKVDNTPEVVEIDNTEPINGVSQAPEGFPADIPIEQSNILESVTTNYPELGARQLSLTYESSQTVDEKYAEYKNYLTNAGYIVTEGDASSPVKAVFGTNDTANLSVVISSYGEKTRVQIAYLLKSAQ